MHKNKYILMIGEETGICLVIFNIYSVSVFTLTQSGKYLFLFCITVVMHFHKNPYAGNRGPK